MDKHFRPPFKTISPIGGGTEIYKTFIFTEEGEKLVGSFDANTEEESKDTADYFARAANMHGDLVEALQLFVGYAEKTASWDKCGGVYYKGKQLLDKIKRSV